MPALDLCFLNSLLQSNFPVQMVDRLSVSYGFKSVGLPGESCQKFPHFIQQSTSEHFEYAAIDPLVQLLPRGVDTNLQPSIAKECIPRLILPPLHGSAREKIDFIGPNDAFRVRRCDSGSRYRVAFCSDGAGLRSFFAE